MTMVKDFPAALATYAACKLYLRPGEAMELRVEDLGLPLQGHQEGLSLHTITIAPQERKKASKTETFDDTVTVDKPVWLGELIENFSRGKPVDSPSFRLTTEEFRDAWSAAWKRLGIRAHPYQLRHAGASIDRLTKTRTATQIGNRGRWKTQT